MAPDAGSYPTDLAAVACRLFPWDSGKSSPARQFIEAAIGFPPSSNRFGFAS
jgi:hypothetical protein